MPRLMKPVASLPFTSNEARFLEYLLGTAGFATFPPRWAGAAARLAARLERHRYGNPVAAPAYETEEG